MIGGRSHLGFDLFEFYRFLLTTLVFCYGCVRLILFIWWWQANADDAIPSSVMRRYVGSLLLRLRMRRFFFDFSTVAALSIVLVLLVRAHWR